MIVLELTALVIGFGAMVFASQRAVDSATKLAAGSNIPPFIIGMTLLAVGTDLPELANSIASSVSDHGDVNVGASVGSTATQITLVLGLLPLLTGSIEVPRKGVTLTGASTIGGLGLLAIFMLDGRISRLNSLALLGFWAAGSFVIHRNAIQNQQLILAEAPPKKAPLLASLALSFGFLAGAAVTALWAIVALAERFDAPEFLVGFFVASFGTSLPELVFDVTALRRGAVAMAIGDVLGSSFLDATASVAIGPLIAPTDVTTDLVIKGTIAAMVATAAVTLILSRIRRHDWRSGLIFLAIYGGFFVVML